MGRMVKRYSKLRYRKQEETYPFLSTIFGMDLEPLGIIQPDIIDRLQVFEDTADGGLMFRQANNLGLGDNRFFYTFRKTGPRRQITRQGEYVFVADEVRILYGKKWPRNEEERRKRGEYYARDALLGSDGSAETATLMDKARYLVWVTAAVVHLDTRNDEAPESRFGKLMRRMLDITVYRAPREGWRRLYEESTPEDFLNLNERVCTRAILDGDREVLRLEEGIEELRKDFYEKVFQKGLGEILRAEGAAMAGSFGSLRMSYEAKGGFGKLLLEDAGSWIVFGVSRRQRCFTVISHWGRLSQLRSLVRGMIVAWNESPGAKLLFRKNGRAA